MSILIFQTAESRFDTFLYMSQISLYWIGKTTKRFGFSRNKGSRDGSNFMVASDLIAEKSFCLTSLSESKFILRILFGDTPSDNSVVIGLRGLYLKYKKIHKNVFSYLSKKKKNLKNSIKSIHHRKVKNKSTKKKKSGKREVEKSFESSNVKNFRESFRWQRRKNRKKVLCL